MAVIQVNFTPRLLYLSAISKLRLLYLSELQQLGKAKLFTACKSFLVVTFSQQIPKDLESLACSATVKAKLYAVENNYFLVTFTSTNFTARDGLVDGKVPNTRAQGAMEGFVEKRRVSCQASL